MQVSHPILLLLLRARALKQTFARSPIEISSSETIVAQSNVPCDGHSLAHARRRTRPCRAICSTSCSKRAIRSATTSFGSKNSFVSSRRHPPTNSSLLQVQRIPPPPARLFPPLCLPAESEASVIRQRKASLCAAYNVSDTKVHHHLVERHSHFLRSDSDQDYYSTHGD